MKNHLNRRALLQGLGTVSIGLPLLEEMITANALGAAKAKVPVRAFNVFFGLGIPAPLQNEGFDDVLEPLQPLSKKLLIMRNVDHVRCDVRGINAHFDGATASFTAVPAGGEAKAGGPSIDQVIRHAHHPKDFPRAWCLRWWPAPFPAQPRRTLSSQLHTRRHRGRAHAGKAARPLRPRVRYTDQCR